MQCDQKCRCACAEHPHGDPTKKGAPWPWAVDADGNDRIPATYVTPALLIQHNILRERTLAAQRGQRRAGAARGGMLVPVGTREAMVIDAAPELGVGTQVQAHSLQTDVLNGLVGVITRRETAGRLHVDFGEPFGVKALRPTNLRAPTLKNPD